MKHLTKNDLDALRIKAGYDDPVTIPRDVFDALIAEYPEDEFPLRLRGSLLRD